MADEDPLKPKTFDQQLLAGGRAHPVLGWIVLGIGVGASFGAGDGNDMGMSVGIGVVAGLVLGIVVTRWTARRRYERGGH